MRPRLPRTYQATESLHAGIAISFLDTLYGSSRGGIIAYARIEGPTVAEAGKSDPDERIWLHVHTQLGVVLVCLWYRPPDQPVAGIQRFQEELTYYMEGCPFTAVFGGLNAHHPKLQHKVTGKTNSAGRRLNKLSMEFMLKQVVRKPTRGDAILDMILTNMGDYIATEVGAEFSDHRIVHATLKLPCATPQAQDIIMWDCSSVCWASLNNALADTSFEQLKQGSAEASATAVTTHVWERMRRHVPRNKQKQGPSSPVDG